MRVSIALVLSVIATCSSARNISISPANPTALEMIQVTTEVYLDCEQMGFAGFEPGPSGRSDMVIGFSRDTDGSPCNQPTIVTFTIGAVPPGAYRVRSKVGSIESTPPSYDGSVEFLVTNAPAAPLREDNLPTEDLSGIWTATTEPFTGFAFINSGGTGAQGRTSRVTGLWYDYSGTQATWTVLLLDGGNASYTGQVVRSVPTGTGPGRTVAFTSLGNATLSRIGSSTRWRLAGTIDGRAVDLTLERFGYTRSAWTLPVITR